MQYFIRWYPCKPVPLEVSELSRSTQYPSMMKTCSHKGFKFCCFEGTLDENWTMVSAPMIIPNYFDRAEGKDCSGLYLLQTGIKAETAKKQ